MRPRRRPDLRLIVIADGPRAAPRSIEDVVAEALEAGAPAIQLRDKAASAAQLYDTARRLLPLTRRHDALLFVNDRLDVALAAEADGVHLGPHDLPLAAARVAIRNAARPADRPELLLGFSTDDPDTARAAAADGADYIGCGAVFGTTSKPGLADERIGPQRLAQVVRAVPTPVVGIGGITPENIEQLPRTGAAGAAVLGAIMESDDIAAVVRALLRPFSPAAG